MLIWQYIPAYNMRIHAEVLLQHRRDSVAAYAAGYDCAGVIQHDCDLVALRNRAVHQAIQAGARYLFSQDSDTWSPMPSGPLIPMIETCEETNAAAVFAMVTMRTRPPKANMWPCKPGEVYDIEKGGTGLFLLDLNRIRRWYEEVPAPLFQRIYTTNHCHTPAIGLDIYLCRFLRDRGERIVCDGRIPTCHADSTHVHEYSPEEYLDKPRASTAEQPEATK